MMQQERERRGERKGGDPQDQKRLIRPQRRNSLPTPGAHDLTAGSNQKTDKWKGNQERDLRQRDRPRREAVDDNLPDRSSQHGCGQAPLPLADELAAGGEGDESKDHGADEDR